MSEIAGKLARVLEAKRERDECYGECEVSPSYHCGWLDHQFELACEAFDDALTVAIAAAVRSALRTLDSNP